MTALLLAAVAAYGVHLVFTSAAFGWSGFRPGPHRSISRRHSPRHAARAALDGAGMTETSIGEALAASTTLVAVGAAAAWVVFGGIVAPVAGAGLGAAVPVAAIRTRHDQRRADAQEAWPRIIEDIRVRTSSLGRSVPQALFDAAPRVPTTMQTAFADARREWLLTTDFERAIAVLKAGLADPTADAACETLLVAHEVGGGDLDRRLAALVHDRILDVNGRKDARAKQAGARFARRFVLVVPGGMAMAGLSIGDGRAAYETPGGQAAIAVGVGVIAACWWWAGAIMRIPTEQRVFHR